MKNACVQILSLMAILCAEMCGCATTSKSVPEPLVLNIDKANDGIWLEAAQHLNDSKASYSISLSDNTHEKYVFNRIQHDGDKSGICLAPRTLWSDSDEDEPVFFPAYCSMLDKSHPEQSLQSVLVEASNRQIRIEKDETQGQFRQRILSMSEPEDPVCFGVFPDIFAVAMGEPSVHLMESYLIACADKIDDEREKSIGMPSHQMAEWMRVQASLLSTDTQFISRAFELARKDDSHEGIGLGKSLEAHVELLFRKTVQAEYTTQDALKISDSESQNFVSRQNIERLHYLVETADSMDGNRLESLIRSMAPSVSAPGKLNYFRKLLQIRTCQMSVIIPDVSSSLVAACMPWLEVSLRDADEYDSALTLIEHGIHGTPEDKPAISPEVLAWLQNTPLPEALVSIRKSFAQRIINLPRLSVSERQVLESF